MHVQVDRDVLIQALEYAYKAIDAKSSMPILGNILVSARDGSLRLGGTNLHEFVAARIDQATVYTDGSVGVDGTQLRKAAKSLPKGGVTLEHGESGFVASAGRARVGIPSVSGEDMPPWPEAHANPRTYEPAAVLSAPVLGSMLGEVRYAMSADETRPHLCGVQFETTVGSYAVRAVATDGHRLAYTADQADSEASAEINGILPVHFVHLVHGQIMGGRAKDRPEGLVRIEAAKGDTTLVRATFDRGPLTLTTEAKLQGESFPPYRKVIPSTLNATQIAVNPRDLINAVDRAKVSADDRHFGIVLRFEESGSVSVESEHPDRGWFREHVDARVHFPPEDQYPSATRTGVNADFLIDALKQIPDGVAKIYLHGGTHGEYNLNPIRVGPASDRDVAHVVVPL